MFQFISSSREAAAQALRRLSGRRWAVKSLTARERWSVKASGTDGSGDGRRQHELEALTAAARVRRGSAQFLPSFIALQGAVSRACARQVEWEAKVCAGIRAVLDFCAAEPLAARALTINARRRDGVAGGYEQELFNYFADRLAGVTPKEARFPISTDEGIIESIAIAVRGHLLADTAEQLPELAPELIYLALMPYTGLTGARHWAESHALVRG
jgi:hypothetical protein